MNNFLKFGLIGIAVWWLLKDNFAFATGDSTDTPSPSPQPDQTTGKQAPPAPPPKMPPADPPWQSQEAIRDAMLTKAAGDPAFAYTVPSVRMTSDQWNYYNAIATGTQTTAELFTAGSRDEKITAVEYWARRQAAGLGRLVWR